MIRGEASPLTEPTPRILISISVDRADTTDLDIEARTRGTVRLSNLHSGYLSAESLDYRACLEVFKGFCPYRRYGTRKVAPLDSVVTHNDHFIENGVVRLHGHIDDSLSVDPDLLGLVADIVECKCSRGRHFDREVSVDVRHDSIVRTQFLDTGSDHRGIGLIEDRTRDSDPVLRNRSDCAEDKDQN